MLPTHLARGVEASQIQDDESQQHRAGCHSERELPEIEFGVAWMANIVARNPTQAAEHDERGKDKNRCPPGRAG